MGHYGRDYGRSRAGMRGGYGMDYGYDRGYIAQSRGFQDAPFRGDAWAGYEGVWTGSNPGRGRGYGRGSAQEYGYRGPGTDLGVDVERGYVQRGRSRAWGRRYDAAYGARFERTRGNSRDRRGGGEWLRAADLMTENPEAVTPDTPLADVARKMKDLDVGILPVVDDAEQRRLQGVITDRDIAIRAVAEGKSGKAKVRELMTTDVEACHPGDSVRDVMEVMRSAQVRRVPITDREGRLVGIIAQADLAVGYAGFDPEREIRVEETLERISEPARPRRGGWR
jgi:CBS domain-containing protein